MTPEEKQNLRARLASMSPEERAQLREKLVQKKAEAAAVSPAAPRVPAMSALESFGRGAVQGATFGFADELAGKAAQLGAYLGGSGVDPAFREDYAKQARDEERAQDRRASQDQPVANLGGDALGSLLSGIVPAGVASRAVGSGMLAGGGIGGALGALTGAGRADELVDVPADAAAGAAVGGALGVAVPALARGAAAVPRVARTLATGARDALDSAGGLGNLIKRDLTKRIPLVGDEIAARLYPKRGPTPPRTEPLPPLVEDYAVPANALDDIPSPPASAASPPASVPDPLESLARPAPKAPTKGQLQAAERSRVLQEAKSAARDRVGRPDPMAKYRARAEEEGFVAAAERMPDELDALQLAIARERDPMVAAEQFAVARVAPPRAPSLRAAEDASASAITQLQRMGYPPAQIRASATALMQQQGLPPESIARVLSLLD